MEVGLANDADVFQSLRLTLLGGFNLLRGTEEIVLPLSAQRLVALLALRERPLSRTYLAGVLWPDCSTERSLADLRTALWRANHCHPPIVAISGMCLRLRSDVQVDVRALVSFGRAIAAGTDWSAIAELSGLSWLELSLDLLPDWYDEWLVDDREGVRQLCLHGLECLTNDLAGAAATRPQFRRRSPL